MSDYPDTLFQRQLAHLGACHDARKWVGTKTFREAWATCPYGSWMRFIPLTIEDLAQTRGSSMLETVYAAIRAHPRVDDVALTRANLTPETISVAYRKLPGAVIK